MQLKEVVELPELKKRDIVIVGHYTSTDGVVFAVLAKRGERTLPVPKLFYLVENGPDNPNPTIKTSEVDSIYRRFGYFEPISTFPSK